jgi:hypothetical protein
MNSIGNKQISIPANHCSACGYDEEEYRGMSYRQWLIGMIASGQGDRTLNENERTGRVFESEMSDRTFATICINKADAIIEILDKEQK